MKRLDVLRIAIKWCLKKCNTAEKTQILKNEIKWNGFMIIFQKYITLMATNLLKRESNVMLDMASNCNYI